MIIRDACPRCKSSQYRKNGHIHNGKPNYLCKDCGRQFVQCFEQHLVSDDTRALIERLLLERISLRGICRAAGVGPKRLLGFIATCFKALPDHGFYVGDRSHDSARNLWAQIPQAYRQKARFYTDQYVVYKGVIPAAQHLAISKAFRRTNHIERFNNTLRQRVSRSVRQSLSFSKKLAHHIGAIKFFVCHYNMLKAKA